MLFFYFSWPRNFQKSAYMAKNKGISLLEVAMILLIITLALAPMVKNIGGPNSADGNSSRVIGNQSKEFLLANTLAEQALSNNYNSFVCNYDGTTGVTFNKSNLPGINTMAFYPSATNRCGTNGNFTSPLYYQWVVKNEAQPNAPLPKGNAYFTAVLNIYSSATGGTPLVTLPTSFFYNASGVTVSQTKIGIIIIQDISGSMIWGQWAGMVNADGITQNVYNKAVASPYLRYRYPDPTVGYQPPANIALPWASGNNAHNDSLDIVSATPIDDPATAWDDRYVGNGTLGLGQFGISDCTKVNNWNTANWAGSGLYSTHAGMGNTQRDTLINICNRAPDWNTMMNQNMSRIEAARGSILNFILSIEADSQLYQNTKLGFETFSSNYGGPQPNGVWNNDPSGLGYDVRVSLETVDQYNRYPNMRRQVSWLNREGPGEISPGFSTNYLPALQKAANELYADPSLSSRLILFVSDGAPNGPGDTHASISAFAKQIGDGTYPGANGNKITLFTLGLISFDPQMPIYLRDDLAQNTPGGQYFQAQNIGDVSPIFDQIKYQVEKTILLDKASRYNVDFN